MGIWQKLFGAGNGPAYFLEDDDAKTFGDIDYMRKETSVERTYPKGFAQDIPVEKVVPPAMDGMGAPKPGGTPGFSSGSAYNSSASSYTPPTPSFNTPPAPSFNTPEPSAATSEPAAEAPKSESPKFESSSSKSAGSNDMDMFRNMAKGIRR
ncbi:MAG: hypothetical protein AAGF75_00335 [Cyanobacteria bacterium P01_H01_bin.130]